MSGPKGIELALQMRIAKQRENINLCATLNARYKRLFNQHSDIAQRLQELGISAIQVVENPDSLQLRIEKMIDASADEQAVEICNNAIGLIESFLYNAQELVINQIAELQRRFRRINDNITMLESERESLLSFAEAALPNECPQDERDKLINLAVNTIKKIQIPEKVEPQLNKKSIHLLQKAEAAYADSLQLLEQFKKQVADAVNQINATVLVDKLIGSFPAEKIEAYIHQSSKNNAAIITIEKKLEKLMANIGALQSSAIWEYLQKKAQNILAEPDHNRCRLLYEDFVVECGNSLKRFKQSMQWKEKLGQLLDQATPWRGTSIDALIMELEYMLRKGQENDLSDIEKRLKMSISEQQAIQEREFRRKILINTLKSLGYETKEGMEAAFVWDGKIIINKPGEDEYAVEVVADKDISILEAKVIRYADSEIITSQNLLKDREQENTWCEDHAELSKRLKANGYDSNFIYKFDAGERPVKTVIDKERINRAHSAATSDINKTIQQEK